MCIKTETVSQMSPAPDGFVDLLLSGKMYFFHLLFCFDLLASFFVFCFAGIEKGGMIEFVSIAVKVTD